MSPNEQILAYSVDIVGDENYVVHFKNIETGHVYPEVKNKKKKKKWVRNWYHLKPLSPEIRKNIHYRCLER